MRSVRLLAVLVLGGCAAVGSDAPATPQRPTFSSNTATTAHGELQLEAGIAAGPDQAFDTPATLRAGVSAQAEVFVGFSPWKRLEGGGADGPGDVVLGVRQRIVDDGPSFAIQLAAKLPTASDTRGLGSGQVDAFVAAILTTGPLTLYYQPGAVGQVGGGTEIEHGLAIAYGPQLTDELSAITEIAAVLRPASDVEQVFTTLGVAWAFDPRTVFDASVVVGLTEEAPDHVLQLGFTKAF